MHKIYLIPTRGVGIEKLGSFIVHGQAFIVVMLVMPFMPDILMLHYFDFSHRRRIGRQNIWQRKYIARQA